MQRKNPTQDYEEDRESQHIHGSRYGANDIGTILSGCRSLANNNLVKLLHENPDDLVVMIIGQPSPKNW